MNLYNNYNDPFSNKMFSNDNNLGLQSLKREKNDYGSRNRSFSNTESFSTLIDEIRELRREIREVNNMNLTVVTRLVEDINAEIAFFRNFFIAFSIFNFGFYIFYSWVIYLAKRCNSWTWSISSIISSNITQKTIKKITDRGNLLRTPVDLTSNESNV